MKVYDQGLILAIMGLVFYLGSYQRKVLLLLILAISLTLVIQSATAHEMLSVADWMGNIKLFLLIPLGMGTLIGFGLLPQKYREKYKYTFTKFINAAVVINIIVMVFVPTGETIRGYTSKIICLGLVLWLMQEMAKSKWDTVDYDRGFFIFSGAPLLWVLCHALYRMCLMSLPVFNTSNFLLLEPLSLGGTYLLYRLHQRRHPWNHYFGYSDSLVAPTMAAFSTLYSSKSLTLTKESFLSHYNMDLILFPLQLILICVILSAVVQNLTRRSLPKL